MAALDDLIERAKKTAGAYGGLLSLLLVVKRGATKNVTFGSASFFVEGKEVNAALIQTELGRIELKIAAIIFRYNEKLFKKEWTLQQWRAAMEALVEDNHILFAALAVGGIDRAARLADVKRRVQRDKTALIRFARALRYKQVPSLPLANNRGRAYIRSIYTTFQLLDQKTHIDAGLTEAKNILSAAEHCRSTVQGQALHRQGCYEISLRGWVDIREMPPIGTRVCGQFCKCHLIYR